MPQYKTIIFFAVLLFALPCLAETQEEIVQKTEDYLNGIRTMQADFLQVAPSGQESTGKFYLSRPGKIRWEYETPSRILIIVSGSLVSYYDYELNQVSHAPSGSSLAEFLAREKISLSGDVKVLSVTEEFGLITITITQAKKPDEGNLTLIFSDSPMMLKKLIVIDAAGKETQVTFENPAFDLSLEKDLFIMKDPNLFKKKDTSH